MRHYLKGALTKISPIFDHWDDPVERRRPDGKSVKGRYTRGFGDAPFTYAGKEYQPEPWDFQMSMIKSQAELVCAKVLDTRPNFTFCLVGLYEDGSRGIPHHSDTVPTLDDVVCSISLGSPRLFEWNEYFINIKEESNTSDIGSSIPLNRLTTRYLLEHGDVMIFDGHSQMNSTHAVPELYGAGERINLTFRTGL